MSYYNHHVGVSFSFGYTHDYYTFVPARNFCDRRITEHVVPTRQTVNIYQNSTVVNNYYVKNSGNTTTVINEGISKDRIASATRSEVPRVSVRDMASNTKTIQPERVVHQGTEAVVYRPKPPPPQMERRLESVRTAQEVRRPAASGTSTTPGKEIPAARSGIAANSSATSVARPGSSPRGNENNAVRSGRSPER